MVCLVYLMCHSLDGLPFDVLFSHNSMPVKWPNQHPFQRVPLVLVPEIMQQRYERSSRLQKSEAVILRPLYSFVVYRGTTLPLLMRK